MSGRLSGCNVIFDYDRTLVPEESLLEVLKLSLRRHGDADVRIRDLQARSDRFLAGAARPADTLALLGGLLSLRREAVEHYVSGARETIAPFRPLFQTLRDEGARLFIVSAAFREWLTPIGASCGFAADEVAANSLRWIGGRAVAPGDWSLLKPENKTALVRRWRRDGVLRGPTIMVGDGASDLGVHASGLAEGFISASYYVRGPTASGPFARQAWSMRDLEPLIVTLLTEIPRR